MMQELDCLSLVVLNYNSYHDTVSCVDRIVSFHKDIHIIIVDNCSSDGSFGYLKEKYEASSDVVILQSLRNGGYSYGNNIGIRYAIEKFDSQIVGVLNPDVIIEDNNIFLSMCEALNANPKLAVIGASTLDADGIYNPNNSGWNIPTGWELVRWHFLGSDRKKKKPHWRKLGENIAQIECVAGCFFLAKADILEEIGYLDEYVFLYNEENLLGIKCKSKGYQEGILLDQFYIHNHRYKKKEQIPFRKKIKATTNVYKSTSYLLRTYYSSAYLPFLSMVEILNKIYLAIAYVKNSFC